jgi:rubredoxin
MEINFECKECRVIFDSEVGKIRMDEQTFRPVFEKSIVCPKCGVRTIDEVFLTELGQSQMTNATMNI